MPLSSATVTATAAEPPKMALHALGARSTELQERRRAVLAHFQSHGEQLHTLLLRLLGPGADADADDLVQETYLLAMRKLERFDGVNLRGWLDALALRLALNHRRLYWLRGRLRAAFSFGTARASTVTPEQITVDREAVARLYRFADRLPPKRRMAFLLVELQGLTPEETAQALTCGVGSIYKHLHLARKALLREYAGSSPFESEVP